MNGANERLVFPVILWMQDYVHVARDNLELCAHVRWSYKKYEECGNWERSCVMAGDGIIWRVEGWRRIRPMGGLRGVALYVMGSVFAAPVLGSHQKMSLEDYKERAVEAVHCRCEYDIDGCEVVDAFKAEIEPVESYSEVVGALNRVV